MHDFYTWDGDDLLLKVRVQPRAHRDEIAGRHGDSLKIRITAPPTEGKANAHLAALLAKELGIPKPNAGIEKGAKGRLKTLRLAGASREALSGLRERWGV